MLKRKEGDIEYLQFELLSQFQEISHGVFLRKGGVSRAPVNSLNVGRPILDSLENILENRRRILKAIGAKVLVTGNQTHEDEILLADPYLEKERWLAKVTPSSDGIFTQKRDVALSIFHADCQAALFYDPKTKTIANVHSGWKGNRLNIYQKTVDTLKKQCRCDPKDLIVCVSPGLGPNHAEFIHYKKEWPRCFHHYKDDKHRFNLWEMAYDQLKNAGVKPNNIEIARICTYENEEDFFSYRRDQTTGRNATLISLKPNT